MPGQVDWENLSAEDIKWLHAWGRDSDIRAHGYGDALDDYLSHVDQGITWDPHDMEGTPESPRESALDPDGRRYSVRRDGAASGHENDGGEGSDETRYEGWKKADLMAECDRRGLDKKGNVQELTDRLLADDAENLPYEHWDEEELRTECKERGMRATGSKQDLVDALYKYDKEIERGGDK